MSVINIFKRKNGGNVQRNSQPAHEHLEDFIPELSHEILSRLDHIYSVIQDASRSVEYEKLPEVKDILEIGVQQTRSLIALMDSMLDFGKIQAGKPLVNHYDIINLSRFFLEFKILYSAGLRATTQGIKLSIDQELPAEILSDRSYLDQILFNLITNAAKHGRHGTLISVDVKKASRRTWSFSVVNWGPGIAPEVLPRIFDPYFTGRNGPGGAGLGLYIIKKKIELLSGTIHVHSTPGLHTSFTVTLPLIVGNKDQKKL